MKILKVDKMTCIQVETDEDDWHIYRRYSVDNWEILMGESWESHYDCEEIERAYQKYLNQKNNN